MSKNLFNKQEDKEPRTNRRTEQWLIMQNIYIDKDTLFHLCDF